MTMTRKRPASVTLHEQLLTKILLLSDEFEKFSEVRWDYVGTMNHIHRQLQMLVQGD